MKRTILFFFLLSFFSALSYGQKREFRAAWIQNVNGQFQGMSREEMQATLSSWLDELRRDGLNAVIFQVRTECDAVYESMYEPWSRFLTGTQGKDPLWDPLAWMVTECHRRGMELHAWINPFRAKTKGTAQPASNHITVTHPELCFDYDGLKILNPALPEARDYVCLIAEDIVSRYDIDGLHIDDYFYPYPVAGAAIPDDAAWLSQKKMYKDRGDWRRHNVNLFIEKLSLTVHRVKPWVKFGVSPFGIYRNKSSYRNGSDTRGLENYDDLYADVLLWERKGWIDYCVPQIYWQIGHPAADYAVLIRWWNDHCHYRPLYIGEDVERTVRYASPSNSAENQMAAKYALHRQMKHVEGTVLWYAKAVTDDIGNYGTALRRTYWRRIAIQPSMTFLGRGKPKKVRKLTIINVEGQRVLAWTAPKGSSWTKRACQYVIYRYNKGEAVNTDDPGHIIAVTADTFLELNGDDPLGTRYAVTALNRIQTESGARVLSVR